MDYRNIFAAVDPEALNATILQRAAGLARASNGEITVVTAIPDLRAMYHGPGAKLQQEFDQGVVDGVRERIAATCRKARVRVLRTLVCRGDVDRVVAQEALDGKADLVLFGNRDRHGLDQYVGGVGLGLLHRVHCDLLAVNLANKGVSYSNPLLSIAGDAHDEGLFDRTRRVFDGPVLHACHVIRPLWSEYLAGDAAVLFSKAKREELRKNTKTALETNLAAYAPFALRVVVGTPSAEIDRVAREGKHDLIVMGSGRHTQLGWHLGSTAHNVLSKAASDVLLIRPDP